MCEDTGEKPAIADLSKMDQLGPKKLTTPKVRQSVMAAADWVLTKPVVSVSLGSLTSIGD